MPTAYSVADRVAELSPREIEVLRLVATGCSTKQIASILNIASKTAACHRMRIMDKLNVHDIAGLTRYAIQSGYIDIYGKAGAGQTMAELASEVEQAHAVYMEAMEAYQLFLVQREDVEAANSDGVAGAARLHQAELAAHNKYYSALLALKDFLTGTSPRRDEEDTSSAEQREDFTNPLR